jgi:hypothetical protein
MKTKHYMLVFTLGVVFTTARAQQFTLKGGLNVSSNLIEFADMPPELDMKSSPVYGFHGGASFDYLFTDRFSLESGLVYMQKGGTHDITFNFFGLTSKVTQDFNFHYVDIPLQAKYRFGNGDVRFFLGLGPYIGIGLWGKVKSTSEFMGNSESETKNLSFGTDFELLELGLCGGAGVEYNSFLLGLNYSYGLNNLDRSASDNDIFKNRVFSVSLGYIINKR